jgi:hypothetical protein
VSPIDLPFDEQYYLAIIIPPDTLSPRTKLTPTPYSYAAKYLAAPATISSSSGPATLTVENTSPGSPTAAQFNGVVRVSDTLRVSGPARIDQYLTVIGNLTKGSGSFKIDHPLDPLNKFLFHSFVESPDMLNVYNGNVVLDEDGEAIVTLPDWFEALNTDFRYQLTPVGMPAPSLHVASKISENRFTIAGGKPGTEVSWQVTGIRNDAYAKMNRIQVEVDKPAEERGTLLHPEAFDASRY